MSWGQIFSSVPSHQDVSFKRARFLAGFFTSVRLRAGLPSLARCRHEIEARVKGFQTQSPCPRNSPQDQSGYAFCAGQGGGPKGPGGHGAKRVARLIWSKQQANAERKKTRKEAGLSVGVKRLIKRARPAVSERTLGGPQYHWPLPAGTSLAGLSSVAHATPRC